MFFFFSLIPATLAAVLGYFILFASANAQGAVRTLGRFLAVWVFALAALIPAAGGYATYADLSPVSSMMQSMHSMHSGGGIRN